MNYTRLPKFLRHPLIKFQRVSHKCLCTANVQPPSSTPPPGTKHYDIVIAGGGMVGTTLACTLGKSKTLANKRILLLEAGKQSKWQLTDKYSNRVVALNPQTFNLFNQIGSWQHIARFGVVMQLHVWDALSDSMINFNHDDMTNIVAYIVENDMLINSVQQEISTLSNVTIINGAKVKGCIIAQEPKIVALEDGSTVSCDLLLGCDGANSRVRDAIGAQYLNWSYSQRGVVATLHLSEASDNNVAWQRFLPTGPIALLPLKDNMSSLIWTTTPAHADTLLQMSDADFIGACNDALLKNYKVDSVVTEMTKVVDSLLKLVNCPPNAIRQLPPNIKDVEAGSRAAFPLGFGHATKYIAEGVVLVGDAAHKIHPLAGQGVNLGFGDIECLNRILGEAVYNGEKLSNMDYLSRYETERQRRNVPTMLAVDGIHRLYNTDFIPLVLMRSLGLQITHACTPVKRAIIGHASS